MNAVISHILEERAIFGVFISDGTFSSQILRLVTVGTTDRQQSYIKIPAEMPSHSHSVTHLTSWKVRDFFPEHSQIYGGTSKLTCIFEYHMYPYFHMSCNDRHGSCTV
jgi:hypothetical protein